MGPTIGSYTVYKDLIKLREQQNEESYKLEQESKNVYYLQKNENIIINKNNIINNYKLYSIPKWLYSLYNHFN